MRLRKASSEEFFAADVAGTLVLVGVMLGAAICGMVLRLAAQLLANPPLAVLVLLAAKPVTLLALVGKVLEDVGNFCIYSLQPIKMVNNKNRLIKLGSANAAPLNAFVHRFTAQNKKVFGFTEIFSVTDK